MLHFSQSISFKFHSNVLRSSGLLAAGKLYVSLFSFIIRHASRHKASSLARVFLLSTHSFGKEPGKLATLWKFRTLKMRRIAHLLHFSQLF